ncbi:MAG: hypothetical protein QOJ81_1539, partial [Chloroflexota bacterium]|nr:hypothetical protein [Chloroflexota bacterium]
TGMSVLAALNQVAQLVAATLYVDYSKDLHFFTGTETNPAPFDLTRPASPPTSYPYRDFSLVTSTPDLAHAVFVQGDGVSVWRTAVGAPTDNTRQERSINDQTIKTLADAQALGDAMLTKWSAAAVEGQLSTYRPGLQGGMTARISNPAWGTDATYVITSVTMRLLGPTLPEYQVGFADHYACKPGQAAFNVAATSAPVRLVNDVLQVIGDVSAAGSNTVPNSSFESAGDWTVGSLWSAAYASAAPYQGSKTARCAPTGTDAGELISAAFIAVDRTQDWWFSFESLLSSRTSGTARCVVREYNAAGTLLASTNIDTTAAETTWTRHSVHFGPTATDSRFAFQATTTKVKIVFLTTGSATLIWEVDAIQFERSAQLTSYAPAPYEIADSTVGTAKIITGSIVTASLAAGAVIALVTNTGNTVIINASGIAVTNGAITVTNPGSTVIIDGSSDIFKIASTGTSTRDNTTDIVYFVAFSGLGSLSAPRAFMYFSAWSNNSAAEAASNGQQRSTDFLGDPQLLDYKWVASSSGGAVNKKTIGAVDTALIGVTSYLSSGIQQLAISVYNPGGYAHVYSYVRYYVLVEEAL